MDWRASVGKPQYCPRSCNVIVECRVLPAANPALVNVGATARRRSIPSNREDLAVLFVRPAPALDSIQGTLRFLRHSSLPPKGDGADDSTSPSGWAVSKYSPPVSIVHFALYVYD